MKPTLLDHLVTQKKYQLKTYAPNEIICGENCLQTKIFFIIKGIVKISHLADNGDEIIPILLTDQMIFGADTIFGQYNAAFSSESLCPTVVYVFEMKDVNDTIHKYPKFHKDLLQILNDKYNEAEHRIRTLKIRSAERRLIEAILEFKEKFGYTCHKSGKIIIKLPFDQEILGKYIRVSRETVCLMINNLRCNSVLDYEQNNIILTKESLQKLQQKSSFIQNEFIQKSLTHKF